MREVAIRVWAKHRVPDLARERDALAAKLAELERQAVELTPRLSWWERSAFVPSIDDARLRALEGEIAELRSKAIAASHAAEAAASSAAAELPPIEIALRVERLITGVLAERTVGRARCRAAEIVTGELTAIADRVAAIWVIDFDTARLSAALAALAASGEPPTAVGEPEPDEQLGFAPIALNELVARAASALHAAGLDALRERVQREAFEYAAAAKALEPVRAALGPEDWLLPGASERERRVASLRESLSREHRELVAANETLLCEIERALGSFPPLGVHVAALAAAGVLHARLESSEALLDPLTGQVRDGYSSCPRALLLAALVELRRATEAAFPGLLALVSGRGGARDAAALARAAGGRAPGPYRERSAGAELDEPSPLHAHEAHARLSAAIERAGTRAEIATALGHAVLLGGIGRAEERTQTELGWFDRLMFWSETPELGALQRFEQRSAWHQSSARWKMNQIALAVDRAAQELHVFRLRNLILNLHRAIRSISTLRGSVSSSTVCPVLNREDALAALSAVADEIARAWGPRGHRQQLAREVAARIANTKATPSPIEPGAKLRVLRHEEIVGALAEALRPTDFAARVARIDQASELLSQAEHTARYAASQVTSWDWLDFLTKSPAEAQRDAWRAYASALTAELRADFARVDALLERALSIYPPAARYYEIGALQVHVLAVRAVRRSARSNNVTRYWCEITGNYTALQALNAWSRAALHTFGAMEPNGDLLEWFVARDLV